MKIKFLAILTALLVLAMPILAQNSSSSQELDINPGVIGPESVFYGFETAWDSAAVDMGLKKAGNVAQERASEAQRAQENGNSEAAQRAVKKMSKVAKKARGENDEEGVNKAMSIVQQTMAGAPEEAKQGLQTALDNMKKAQQQRENSRQGSENVPNQTERNPSGPDEETNNTRPDARDQDLQQNNSDRYDTGL